MRQSTNKGFRNLNKSLDPLITDVSIKDERGSFDQVLNPETAPLPVDSLSIDFSLLESTLSAENFSIDFMDNEILEEELEEPSDRGFDEEPNSSTDSFSFWAELEGSGSGDSL